MAYHYATQIQNEHTAKALGKDLQISSKLSIEVCNYLRYRPLQKAKLILDRVAKLQQAIPVRRFTFDQGHKKKIGPGRYPVKVCEEILKILRAAEANAQFKGLNTSLLHIVHMCAHKGGAPLHPGRHGRTMKRTHVEVVVEEKPDAKKERKEEKKERERPHD